MHVDEVLQRFMIQLSADGRSPHTIAQVRRHVLRFSAWLVKEGHAGEIGSIEHEHVALFFASDAVRLCDDGSARLASSANAIRSSIKGLLRFAHEAGYASTNAGRLIRRAMSRQPRPKALSAGDQEKLVARLERAQTPAEQRDRALFLTLLRTGIRIGSALALDVADVDFDRQQLTLRAQKGGGTDVVFFGDDLACVLRDAIGSRREGALFLSSHGARLGVRQARRRLVGIAREAGIGSIGPHVLRHSFATRLAHRTNDLFLVARALTHQSLSTTLRYAAASDEALRRAVAM